MLVPFITVNNTDSYNLIVEGMKNVQENKISCINWPEEYPSSPNVSFKMAHNGTHLFLHYFVEENEILAKTEKDNGPVWTDSCVEFFISFNDYPFYYNLESSCIGKVLFGYRKDRQDVEYGNSVIMDSIRRFPSLGYDNFEKKEGDFKWNLLLIIPVSSFWKSDIRSLNGMRAKANLYKCGDDLSVPHFLSWQPIKTEKPNFHMPAFFSELVFE